MPDFKYIIRSFFYNYRKTNKNQYKNCVFGENVSIGHDCDLTNCKFDNYVNLAYYAQAMNTHIGKRTSIGRYSKLRDCEIGKYCSISWDVTIGAVTHPFENLSSHAFTYRKQFGIAEKDVFIEQKQTIIGNDVWIGCNSVIISGVHVGDGAVIGAGAVVTKDIPPYSVVGGVPARIIRNRYAENWINEYVKQIKWWDWNDEILIKALPLFNSALNKEKIEEIEQFIKKEGIKK